MALKMFTSNLGRT